MKCRISRKKGVLVISIYKSLMRESCNAASKKGNCTNLSLFSQFLTFIRLNPWGLMLLMGAYALHGGLCKGEA